VPPCRAERDGSTNGTRFSPVAVEDEYDGDCTIRAPKELWPAGPGVEPVQLRRESGDAGGVASPSSSGGQKTYTTGGFVSRSVGGSRTRPAQEEATRDTFNRSWASVSEDSPSKRQNISRRARMRYRRNKRAQAMADTALARRFTKLMQMYQRQKRPRKIMEDLTEARAAPPEERILNCINYNAALNALVELGDTESAKEVFQWIIEDVGADVVALSTMIKAYGKSDAVDDAFALLDEYEERTRRTAPRRVYMNLLNACATAGDVHRARAMMHRINIIDGVEMQQKLRSRQQRQQRQQFNQYGGGQPVQPGRPGDADGGAEEGDAATQHRFKLGSFDLKSKLLQFNLLIKAYCNSATPLAGWAVLTDMRRSGVPPDRVTFNQLMVGASRSECEAGAEMAGAVMERMRGLAAATQDAALLPDNITYSNALRAAAWGPRALEAVQALVCEIEDGYELAISEQQRYLHRFRPDAECCATVVEVLCDLGEPERALQYMDKWQSKGQKSRPRGILALMRAYSDKGDLDAVKYLHARFIRQELAGKISGPLLYEANLLVAQARKTAYRRRSAFNAALIAEAQAEAGGAER